MATHSEHSTSLTGIKKVWDDAVSTLQTRVKDAEKIWTGTASQLGSRFATVEKDVRGLAGKVESDGRKHFEALKEQIKFDELKERMKPSEVLAEGARFTSETIEKLGLPTREDFENLARKVEQLGKGGAKAAAPAVDVESFDKRIAALEAGLKALEKKLASAPAAKATEPKAAAPKKEAAPKKAVGSEEGRGSEDRVGHDQELTRRTGATRPHPGRKSREPRPVPGVAPPSPGTGRTHRPDGLQEPSGGAEPAHPGSPSRLPLRARFGHVANAACEAQDGERSDGRSPSYFSSRAAAPQRASRVSPRQGVAHGRNALFGWHSVPTSGRRVAYSGDRPA
jgi:hypothetical protein